MPASSAFLNLCQNLSCSIFFRPIINGKTIRLTQYWMVEDPLKRKESNILNNLCSSYPLKSHLFSFVARPNTADNVWNFYDSLSNFLNKYLFWMCFFWPFDWSIVWIWKSKNLVKNACSSKKLVAKLGGAPIKCSKFKNWSIKYNRNKVFICIICCSKISQKESIVCRWYDGWFFGLEKSNVLQGY